MSDADYSSRVGDYFKKAVQASDEYFSKPQFTEGKVGKGVFGKVEVYVNKENIKSALHTLSFTAAIVPFTAGLIYGAAKLIDEHLISPMVEDDLQNTGTNILSKKEGQGQKLTSSEKKMMAAMEGMPYEVSVDKSPTEASDMTLTFTARDGQPSLKDFEKELTERFAGLRVDSNQDAKNKYQVVVSDEGSGKFTCKISHAYIAKMPLMLNNSDFSDGEAQKLKDLLTSFGMAENEVVTPRTDGSGLKELGIPLSPKDSKGKPNLKETAKRIKKQFPDATFNVEIHQAKPPFIPEPILYMNISVGQARKILDSEMIAAMKGMPYDVSVDKTPTGTSGMTLTFNSKKGQPSLEDFKKQLTAQFPGLKVDTDQNAKNQYQVIASDEGSGKFTCKISHDYIEKMPLMLNNSDFSNTELNKLKEKLQRFGMAENDTIEARTDDSGLNELGIRLSPKDSKGQPTLEETARQIKRKFPDATFSVKVQPANPPTIPDPTLYMNISVGQARKILDS